MLSDSNAAQPSSSHQGIRARAALTRETYREPIDFALRPTRRNLLHWASWALAFGVELILVVVLWNGRIFGWEQSLTRRLQDVPGKELVFDVSSLLTNTISVGFLLIFLATVSTVYLLGQREAALLLVLTIPLHAFALFPKVLVDRTRPSSAFEGIEGVGGPYSFPSGHAEYVVTFYGFLTYLLMLHVTGRWPRAAIFAGWVVLVLATGFGRVALGRHWPLDVLTAYLIGLGLLSGMIWLHSAIRHAKADAPSH
ncbi:MAG: phosphatase PAP2 family protein [Thermomicrobiales bacterium]